MLLARWTSSTQETNHIKSHTESMKCREGHSLDSKQGRESPSHGGTKLHGARAQTAPHRLPLNQLDWPPMALKGKWRESALAESGSWIKMAHKVKTVRMPEWTLGFDHESWLHWSFQFDMTSHSSKVGNHWARNAGKYWIIGWHDGMSPFGTCSALPAAKVQAPAALLAPRAWHERHNRNGSEPGNESSASHCH